MSAVPLASRIRRGLVSVGAASWRVLRIALILFTGMMGGLMLSPPPPPKPKAPTEKVDAKGGEEGER